MVVRHHPRRGPVAFVALTPLVVLVVTTPGVVVVIVAFVVLVAADLVALVTLVVVVLVAHPRVLIPACPCSLWVPMLVDTPVCAHPHLFVLIPSRSCLPPLIHTHPCPFVPVPVCSCPRPLVCARAHLFVLVPVLSCPRMFIRARMRAGPQCRRCPRLCVHTHAVVRLCLHHPRSYEPVPAIVVCIT